ncbi:MAG: acyl-CoA desaturase [Sphingobacteriaceae bacterium]|nr:acyl-CoA desaturase [Sphingobacteriaceae bacterium]
MTVKKRVDEYFKTNNISKFGNYKMVLKTIAMFIIFLGPYAILMSNIVTNGYAQMGLWIMMGIGMSGVGLSVMHDANHGSYSKNTKINKLMTYSMTLIGGSSLNWQLQHNNLHHTFTNIEGHDEDIAPLGFLRFSPHAEYRKIHKFQFLYAWFFYGLMTLMWAFTKDFSQLIRYNKMGLLKGHNTTFKVELIKLSIHKVVYLGYNLVLPLIFIEAPIWQILLGFFAMHFTCGLILALIFQPAHVVEETEFPTPAADGVQMEDDWASHQMKTTANFAPKNWLLSWFVGGLNFQVEHHLFPNICHVHYKKIAPIIKETAKEFNLPYHSKPTFIGAVISHAKLLYQLGRPNQQQMA